MTVNPGIGRPIVLQGSARLNAWIEQGGPAERRVIFRTLRHRWAGMWFDHCAEVTSRKCLSVMLPLNPTFIVGLWRTGSTALHFALANDKAWTTPRTWQTFRPAHFLLTPPPKGKNVVRPMDSGVIDTFSPQEDEFASLLLGEDSAYRALIDPRRFPEATSILDRWEISDHETEPPLSHRWETFLRAVLVHSPGRLILKSPNHTFRLPWLAERFPQARFVWIVRRERDVMESNMRMWTVMARQYGQWHLHEAALKMFLSHAKRHHDNILDWAKTIIPSRLYLVTFEDVMHDMPDLISRIGEFLRS